MGAKGLENLTVWQMAREIVVFVYQNILPNLPSQEKFIIQLFDFGLSKYSSIAVSISSIISSLIVEYFSNQSIMNFLRSSFILPPK